MTVSGGTAATVAISSPGGIETIETTIPPGVTLLSGENATNRTAFLRSVAAALGADTAAARLKADAEAGEITGTFEDTATTRTDTRTNGAVVRDGDPLSERSELVDTSAALSGTNSARTAIRNGGDELRDVLMRGVDRAAISARRHSLREERDSLEGGLEQIETARNELPDLRGRERSLETDLEETAPMVLFNSVESIDATRLERLFEYINDYAPFLVCALLPAEASAIDRPTLTAPEFERVDS